MQLCMRNVDTKAVMTVRMKLPIFSAEKFFLKGFIRLILFSYNGFHGFYGFILETNSRNYS